MSPSGVVVLGEGCPSKEGISSGGVVVDGRARLSPDNASRASLSSCIASLPARIVSILMGGGSIPTGGAQPATIPTQKRAKHKVSAILRTIKEFSLESQTWVGVRVGKRTACSCLGKAQVGRGLTGRPPRTPLSTPASNAEPYILCNGHPARNAPSGWYMPTYAWHVRAGPRMAAQLAGLLDRSNR